MRLLHYKFQHEKLKKKVYSCHENVKILLTEKKVYVITIHILKQIIVLVLSIFNY